MGKGKYSPTAYSTKYTDYVFNAKGQPPVGYDTSDKYDPETMSDHYDCEGYDSYGYSAYDRDGKFVGSCYGVDRNGLTENDYLSMSDEEYNNL